MVDEHTEVAADVTNTTCCIVGAGPAGMVLSLLLARKGIDVTLLEAHKDFDRDFRGDTIHPSTLEILDQLGLADRLLEIPHGKVRKFEIITENGAYTIANLIQLRTRFPFIAMLPQQRFLDFLAAEARRFSNFHLILGANVQRLVQEGDRVVGVRYRGAEDAWHEVRAALTVATDGRFSKIRSLLELEPIKTAPPMDVVWFRLPRKAGDPVDSGAVYTRAGHFAVLLDRAVDWQVGYVILKGTFQHVRVGGIEAMRQSLATMVPWLGDRVESLQDWKQVSVLSVESSRLAQWHRPGVLLIGDAAHVMSPVGGVGINYAIQDAVETANLLAGPLKSGNVTEAELAAVQRNRERPTKVIQRIQGVIQKRIAAPALAGGRPFRPPIWLRIMLWTPILRNIPGRLFAFGIGRVKVNL